MSEPAKQIDPSREEDFGVVMARARAKARGVPYRPGERVAAATTAKVRANEQNLSGLIDRFMARAAQMPTRPRLVQDDLPRAATPSAIDVRLGWYIPPRHRHDTLENFRPVTDSQHDALRAVRDWIESVLAGDGGALALVGGVGTGKSHLLYAAIREINLRGRHGAAFGWYDLAEVRRDAKFGDDQARKQWARLLGAFAFGLDEIRPTAATEFDTTELSQLMTRAYRECQGVIVTSNHAGDSLTEIVGRAAISRLTRVTIIGPDMRDPHNRGKYLRKVEA